MDCVVQIDLTGYINGNGEGLRFVTVYIAKGTCKVTPGFAELLSTLTFSAIQ